MDKNNIKSILSILAMILILFLGFIKNESVRYWVGLASTIAFVIINLLALLNQYREVFSNKLSKNVNMLKWIFIIVHGLIVVMFGMTAIVSIINKL
ncbi:MAG: hypothetical protein SOZ40_06810 [Ezakiella sp.]|nr:hypothetical protein [Ezakiella sp.]MDD7761528.1 hypothetical protein [Bacillota bacterium]MDY3947673.1 hypothetical protein [Ezakiella sp.]